MANESILFSPLEGEGLRSRTRRGVRRERTISRGIAMNNARSTRTAVSPWYVAIVAGMASYIDSSAIVSFGIIITIYTQTLGFTEVQTGIGSAALTLGIAIGAIVGGRLGDRFGRRPIFSLTMAFVIVGALLAIVANSFTVFLLGAILVGLGTGGDLPVSLSTISEAANDEERGKLVGFSNVLWLVGIVAAMLGGVLVGNLGRVGAQLLLAHFGLVAAVVLLARLRIPESAAWIEARQTRASSGTTASATRGNLTALFGPEYRAPFLGLIVFYSLVNLGANTFGQFNTYLLVNVAGTSVSTASLLNLLSFPIMFVSAFWFMRVVDGKHRFTYYTVSSVVAMAAMFVYVFFGFSVASFVVVNVLIGITAGFCGEAIMKVWTQESFPTLLRTTAQGTIIASARFLAAALASVTPLLINLGIPLLFSIVGAVAAVGYITAWAVFRTRDGQSAFAEEREFSTDEPAIA